jgi:hypothetical protein
MTPWVLAADFLRIGALGGHCVRNLTGPAASLCGRRVLGFLQGRSAAPRRVRGMRPQARFSTDDDMPETVTAGGSPAWQAHQWIDPAWAAVGRRRDRPLWPGRPFFPVPGKTCTSSWRRWSGARQMHRECRPERNAGCRSETSGARHRRNPHGPDSARWPAVPGRRRWCPCGEDADGVLSP